MNTDDKKTEDVSSTVVVGEVNVVENSKLADASEDLLKKEVKISKDEKLSDEISVEAESKTIQFSGTKNSEDDEEGLFVREDNTFEVSVKYSMKSGDVYVNGIDEEFDESNAKELITTFKFPSHGDCSMINATARQRGVAGGTSDYSVRDYQELEAIRMAVLIRSWNIKKTLNDKNVMDLSPKIVLALLAGIRNKVGISGIV